MSASTPRGAQIGAASPAERPLRLSTRLAIESMFDAALAAADGAAGAHCIHELWMRDEMSLNIEAGLERLWKHAAPTIPEWLPTRYFDWLRLAYQAAGQFRADSGQCNIYLVLLDYRDSRHDPYGG